MRSRCQENLGLFPDFLEHNVPVAYFVDQLVFRRGLSQRLLDGVDYRDLTGNAIPG
jgi:hypothetical protein